MQLLQITDCLPCIRRTHQREEETLGWVPAQTDKLLDRQRDKEKREMITSHTKKPQTMDELVHS